MATIVMTAYPGCRTERGGYQVCMSLAKPAPRRIVEVKKVADVAGHVRSFGEAVRAANPSASFMVSARVANGQRKPAGFDAANKLDGFGGKAFLRPEGEVSEAETYRDLISPSA